MTWTILLTTPQSEFRVRDELHRRGLSAYVPVEFRWTRHTVKPKRAMRLPVLPGYVFAEIDHWSALVQRTTRTVRIGENEFVHEDGMLVPLDGLAARPILMIEGKPAVMSINAVIALQALSQPLTKVARGTRLNIGDRIKIKIGALTDLQADVARITAKGRPVAVVQLFGKDHTVTLGDGQWEAA